MRQYHPLTVAATRMETPDAVRIALDVPAELRAEFGFRPGQHLPVQAVVDGSRLRRTYSICSVPGEWPLEIGIRVQPGGQFSEYAAREIDVGDVLDVMPPTGRFHVDVDPGNRKFYLGFAAGSGITPILSILRTVLQSEPQSRFALFYGNRAQRTTMFIDDLYALKNRFPDRLQLHFVFSREDQEFDIAGGRLDREKTAQLCRCFCRGENADEAFICGPDTMTATVGEALSGLGMPADMVHVERFGVPRGAAPPARPATPDSGERTTVTVIMDGHRRSFEMPRDGASIVDAAADSGVELPYSCKGGVCATCRTHLRSGEVRMDNNYGLEPWELDAGFVLACQSHPVGDAILLDYDKS